MYYAGIDYHKRYSVVGIQGGSGAALNGASKAGRGEKRRGQRRETCLKPGGCKSHAVMVGHQRQALSCVVAGDGATKRRQRLWRPGASISKETPSWGSSWPEAAGTAGQRRNGLAFAARAGPAPLPAGTGKVLNASDSPVP
jgi:hypothetical protein